MLSFSKSPARAARNAWPASHHAAWPLRTFCAAAAATVVLCALGVGASAQRTIPQSVTLRTGYVGVPYEFWLQELLPKGAPILKWSQPICTGGEEDGLECPSSVSVREEDRKDKGKQQKLIVQPVVQDLEEGGMPKSYAFDITGTNSAGINVRVRFNLDIMPLGVDTSKFEDDGGAQDGRRQREEDDVRSFVSGVAPARRIPKPPAPKPAEPFVLVKSTGDKETMTLNELFDDGFNPRADPCVICPDTDNRANFYIRDANVEPLVNGTIGTDVSKTANFQNGDYLVVHIVKWKPVKDGKSDKERELWALFEKINERQIGGRTYRWLPHFAASEKGEMANKRIYDTRIFGSRRVFVLPVHLDTPPTWDIKYTLNLDQQIPTNIQNATQLAGLILGGGSGGPRTSAVATTKDIWGARLMLVRYSASDMLVDIKAVTPDTDLQLREQNKDYSKKYENEGRQWWDVSVGLPANSINELEYTLDTTGANSAVSVKKVERQNAYGFLNLFPRPVDLKGKSFLTKPHLVLGVPISGKPLDRPIVALGTGIYRDLFKINFFAGVAFNKVREPRTLQVGDTATAGQLETDLRTRREPKFVFGINFPVRQFIQALKGSQ